MPKAGKKYIKAAAARESKAYSLTEAVPLLQKIAFAKFNETVEISMKLGVDPKHADQMVRGTVVLPNGLGKSKKVIVIASGDKVKEARDAGADEVGGEEIVEKIAGGWMDFDAVVASPDMMPLISKVARVLGPRGLMPNPKTGTVTMEIGKAVKEVKAGKIDFRVDKFGIIHASVAKTSFDKEKIVDNARELLQTVIKLKPASAKGTYIKSIYLSSTMSPGVQVEPKSVTIV